MTLFFTLVLTAIVCILLGCGVPTTATYIIMVTVAAPTLGLLGVAPIVAHFFVFYYGVLADITPPVALAAYAGASMAGADPFKTGNTAFRLALGKVLVPFVFVYGPSMLIVTQGFTWTDFLAHHIRLRGRHLDAVGGVRRLHDDGAGAVAAHPVGPRSIADHRARARLDARRHRAGAAGSRAADAQPVAPSPGRSYSVNTSSRLLRIEGRIASTSTSAAMASKPGADRPVDEGHEMPRDMISAWRSFSSISLPSTKPSSIGAGSKPNLISA